MREEPLTRIGKHITVLDIRKAPYLHNPEVRAADSLWSWVDYRIGKDTDRNPSNSHMMIPGTIELE